MTSLLGPWFVWALLAALFAAATALLAKAGVEDVNSDLAMLIRTAVVLVAAGMLVAFTGKWQPVRAISGRTWLFLVASGLATGLSWLCYFRALKLGDAARVASVDKLSVVFVAVLAGLLFAERLSPLNWLGVALISAGAMLVAWKG